MTIHLYTTYTNWITQFICGKKIFFLWLINIWSPCYMTWYNTNITPFSVPSPYHSHLFLLILLSLLSLCPFHWLGRLYTTQVVQKNLRSYTHRYFLVVFISLLLLHFYSSWVILHLNFAAQVVVTKYHLSQYSFAVEINHWRLKNLEILPLYHAYKKWRSFLLPLSHFTSP